MKHKVTDTKKHIRQKLLILLLAASILSLYSCAAVKADPLAYRLLPFTAEISGRITPESGKPIDFSATVTYGKYAEADREVRILFRAPDSLSGLLLMRHPSGVLSLSYRDVQLSLEDVDAISTLIKISEMLDPRGEILGISSISGNTAAEYGYGRLTLVETARCRITVDPHTSYPVRAEYSDGEIYIVFDAVTARI